MSFTGWLDMPVLRRIPKFAVLASIFLCMLPVAGQQIPLHGPPHNTTILDDEFSTWIEEIGKAWGMKGVAVAVVRKISGGDKWATETKGYGVADRWGNSVDENTLFSIGSNSKHFTALAVGMLVENDSIPLSWDSKIKEVIPNVVWGLQDKIAEDHANLVDILSHRTGLPRHELSYSKGDGVENTLYKLRYLRPSAEFRETFQYTNQMYMLASHIVAYLANIPFTEFVTRNILSPLGFSFTTYNVTQAQESGRLVDGFIDTGFDAERGEGRRKARFRPVPYWISEDGKDIMAGPGGVISNAKDLAIWLQTLLLSGHSPVTGEAVIPVTVINRTSRGVTTLSYVSGRPELSPTVYGMGQMTYSYQGHELIEHNGGVIGQNSVITRAPNDGLGIAVLTNWQDGGTFVEIVKYRLLEKALGLPAVDWDERFRKTREEAEALRAPPPPSTKAQTTTVPIQTLEGIYFNPAYGTLSLCMYPPSFHAPRPGCMASLPDEIRPLLNATEPVLFAAWPKVWSTHLLLRHDVGDNFVALPVNTFPAPFPHRLCVQGEEADDDNLPFAVVVLGASWSARFVTLQNSGGRSSVQGMAWTGVWQAEGGVRSPSGKSNEDVEVWFDRVV